MSGSCPSCVFASGATALSMTDLMNHFHRPLKMLRACEVGAGSVSQETARRCGEPGTVSLAWQAVMC